MKHVEITSKASEIHQRPKGQKVQDNQDRTSRVPCMPRGLDEG